MLTKGTEPKQALGNETNPGDEKWLEQEEQLERQRVKILPKQWLKREKQLEGEERLKWEEHKKRLEWEKLDEWEKFCEWKDFEEHLELKGWEERLEWEGGEEWLEWEEHKKWLEWEKLDEREKWSLLQDWLEERKWHQENNEHHLIRECFEIRCNDNDTLIDSAKGLGTINLMRAWFCDESDLTENQKKLNTKLLNILSGYPDTGGRGSYSSKVCTFLERNKNNKDLKTVLNLKRGESGLTVLHAVVSMAAEYGGRLAEEYVSAACSLIEAEADPNVQNDRWQTPLHYAAIGSGGDSIVYLIEAGADPNARDIEGKTSLHYAAGLGHNRGIELLLRKKAKCDVLDETRKTPLQVAIDNHQYHVKEYFPTDNQKRLKEELYGIMGEYRSPINDYWDEDDVLIAEAVKNLKEFLDKYESDQDLKVVLNFHDEEGKSIMLQHARGIFSVSEAATEVEGLLLKAGATDQEDYSREKCLPKSRTLWDDLTPDQKKKRDEFFAKVNQAQDIKQLEEVVDQTIRSGVRLNFIDPGEVAQQDKGNFTDHVMKKISALKESSEIANDIEIASGIIYKLVSKGAALHNLDRLESGFKDHKTNIKRPHENYVNNALKFMKIVKSAASGRVKDAKMDNSTFYLEYSEDSTINVAKITDGARDLGLVQGEIEYGRDIIRIGKSEVEIITKNCIRNYTDLADNSNIVLTFHTSQGKLDVRLYPDVQDKSKIIVKVEDQEKWKNCNEKIGENCLLGKLPVNQAIKQGFFIRPGKLCQPSEKIGLSKKFSKEVIEAVKDLKYGDIVSSPSSNIFPPKAVMQEGQVKAPGA
ncbi:ankyrin repeat domain-containing protein [Wolbachia endosymbiont (group A) of Anomoia purmunda]|uniref:ankyrin repeat domain-containing protein n=1 Tax=Wolbachia endosymbiont (group A) of Anomoia purmunda TaxID=2953978 RepID=UPI002231DAE1|nr:ankyrin repeat domain-containing protein [Wolbachia endosymbiont (group A) of Anomoia purmunda]